MYHNPGIWTKGNTNFFYNVLNWLLGQAAPVLLMLFAGFVIYLVIRVIYSATGAEKYMPEDIDKNEDYEED